MSQTTSHYLNEARVNIFLQRRRIILVAVLAIGTLVCSSIWGFVSRAHNRAYEAAALEPLKLTANPPRVPTAQAPPGLLGPVEVVQFALYDVGIYPRQIHATQGIVGICFEDLSGGMNQLVVRLETGGAPIGVVLRTGPGPRGRNDFRMVPGRYSIFMADHPEMVSTLIVDPQ
jgi:hypothetical protein